MIDTWDEDICPSCIQPSFFAHECSPCDSNVTAHVSHVRQTIASTPLLQYIQEAYNPQSNSLQASNPVSMNTSFFLQAEGHSADSTGERSPIHQYESQNDESDNQSDSDSRSSEEDPQSDTHSDNAIASNSDNNLNSRYNDNTLYSDSEHSNEE